MTDFIILYDVITSSDCRNHPRPVAQKYQCLTFALIARYGNNFLGGPKILEIERFAIAQQGAKASSTNCSAQLQLQESISS